MESTSIWGRSGGDTSTGRKRGTPDAAGRGGVLLERCFFADDLFAGARSPLGALAGLYLCFSCREEAHETAQSDSSAEGSYWHAIVHRQEPDPGNSSYWFHRVGEHAVFPRLLEAAEAIAARHPDAALRFAKAWDPFEFIEICEHARRRPGSALECTALEIQRAEWQLLFDYCARRSSC